MNTNYIYAFILILVLFVAIFVPVYLKYRKHSHKKEHFDIEGFIDGGDIGLIVGGGVAFIALICVGIGVSRPRERRRSHRDHI